MPGVYAKQFAGNPQTRRTSNRIDLPPGWQGTTGGAPGKALEIFVLTGDLEVGDIRLGVQPENGRGRPDSVFPGRR